MSERSRIEERRKRLIDTAHLLKQVPDGATTFSEQTEDGKRQLIHNGIPTGVFVSETIYRAVTNQSLPEPPKIRPEKIEIYDLRPSELEHEFLPMYDYIEAVTIYMMVMFDMSADGVEVVAQRMDKDTVQWTIRKAKDDEDGNHPPLLGN